MKLGENLIKIGLFTALLTPLFYASNAYPYTFSKAMFFQIVVEVVLFGWLLLFLNNPERYKPSLGLVGKALLFFVAIAFLSGVFGTDFNRSLFSTAQRADGVVFLLHGAAFLIMLSSVFKSLEDWLKLLRGATLVGVAVGIYGVLEKVAPDFINRPPVSNRLIATLGNADFLGSYSLFLIFLPGVVFLLEKKKKLSRLKKYWWRSVYLACSGLGVYLLLFSGTRGALVGLVGGIVVSAGMWLVSGSGWLQKSAVVLLLLLVIGGGVLLYFYQDAPLAQQVFNKIPVFGRLFDEGGLRMGTSAKTRLLSIGMGLQSLKDAPLLGQGWSNWYVVFDKYFNPEYLKYTDDWFDKAHNMPLEVLVTTGVIGFASYLAVFLLLLIILWSNKKTFKGLVVVLLGMIAAYFVQNLALFDTPSTWVMLLLVVGFVDQFPQQALENKAKLIGEKLSKFEKVKKLPWSRYLSSVLLVVIPFVFYFCSVKPLVAAQKMKGESASYQRYREILEGETFLNYNAVINLGGMITGTYSEGKANQLEPLLELEIKYLKKQIEKHPNNMKLKLLLARMYNYRGAEDKQYFEKADQILKRAVELAPRRPEVLIEKCVTEMKQENYEQAISYCKEGAEYSFDSPSYYWKLAVAYSGADKNQEAIEVFKKAKSEGLAWKRPNRLSELVSIYSGLNNYEKVNEYYGILVEKKPKDPQYRISYAISLAKAGNYQQAVKQMEKAVELEPKLKSRAAPYLEKWRKKL